MHLAEGAGPSAYVTTGARGFIINSFKEQHSSLNKLEALGLFAAPNMANNNYEELSSKVTSEDEEHIYEHIYDTLASSDKPELNHQMAIDELITTEANYVHNLQLCIFNIRNHLQKKQLPEIDLEGLFSNIDDVLQVSKCLLKGLEASVNQGHEQLFHISTLFQELKAEMENVYKIYCGDYDQALLLLDIYSKEPRLQKEIMETLTTTVPHTGASNLSFFLVMPVQRITKYPLLLQKIVENTSGTDSAYGALQAAATAMTDVNANINEYKRRKEIADKYNKAGYLTLRERLARLNTHSIAKKTARLSRLFMHEAGIVTKTEDKEFDKVEEKFQSLASAIIDLKENVACFLDNTEVPSPWCLPRRPFGDIRGGVGSSCAAGNPGSAAASRSLGLPRPVPCLASVSVCAAARGGGAAASRPLGSSRPVSCSAAALVSAAARGGGATMYPSRGRSPSVPPRRPPLARVGRLPSTSPRPRSYVKLPGA
ncbi:rho guanine nucleotide exchange factor 37 [Crotalus adamanteus]|uniref:Rho guanine nucleotide exchange factor 37 n=1 Tax=Crotalus adamanteus TaxID=8729 RepID=A0AAW1BW53_CROAD